MKSIFTLLLLSICTITLAQQKQYEPTENHPYGMLNPAAPAGTADFDPLVGTCDCKSVSRNPDGTWQDSLNMEWQFKYIMNGTAVQDEVWRENDLMAGSIRQYNADSALWYVSYYTSAVIPASLPAWSGAKDEEGNIVLYKDQLAPNGAEGFSILTFQNITSDGFNWKGEWISADESIVYPFWTISCAKREKK